MKVFKTNTFKQLTMKGGPSGYGATNCHGIECSNCILHFKLMYPVGSPRTFYCMAKEASKYLQETSNIIDKIKEVHGIDSYNFAIDILESRTMYLILEKVKHYHDIIVDEDL